ncbi:Protein SEY1, related [Eimeria necatrix]|uniref:Protein SEY1, related n=1 Tax=Eimeria necatrix TaxID=51315 RepID=U6N6U5_9EIME|nr:Protein SEY1, related [Eimeria necatrix]CDJ69606.1 Protein SEY1, related [Eimeria necatrix]
MKDQGLADVGFSFNVITILGSQSSGKSTLMNSLFGCSFQVMDAQKGYSQTTKGLWVGRDNLHGASSGNSTSNSDDNSGGESKSSDSLTLQRPVLILDVEGLDSRERGDRRQTYENFFSLFALALADCLLVNISCSALGCHTGSGFGLLKTVMEANLELFMRQDDAPKTILLFAVRDWAPTIVPEDVMKERIVKDYVDKIWSEIEKPDSAADRSAEDFFTVEVVGLAHKLLAPEEFEKDVIRLRTRWANEFSPKSYTRNVPADGFGAYAKNIWETIKQQSHLDIPNQKEMLAIYRCQDLKQQALQMAASRAAALQQQYLKPTAADTAAIKKEMTTIVQDALTQYLSQATRYQEKICTSVKTELIDALISTLKPIVDSQLSEARARIARKYKDALREAYTRDPRNSAASAKGELMLEAWAAFRKRSAGAIAAATADFEAFSEECSIEVESGDRLHFPSSLIADSLRQEMQQEVQAIRENQQKFLDEAIAEKCADGFTGIDALLSARDFSPPAFWEVCRGRAAANATVCAAHFGAAARGLDVDTDEAGADAAGAAWVAEFAVRCRVVALWQLRTSLSKLAGTLHVYVTERFTMFFAFDEDDQPRRWEVLSAEKLQSLFLTAKSQALLLIPTLREMQLERLSLSSPTLEAAAGETETGKQTDAAAQAHATNEKQPMPAAFYRPLIDSISEQAIQRRAVASMQQQCREAQLLQQRCGSGASWRSVPLWGWLLLICLGWNEIGMVVSFATSNWLILPLLLLGLLLGAAVLVSGQMGIATNSAKHMTQLVRLLLQPFLYGLLKRATDLMDPSGLAGRGITVPPAGESKSPRKPKERDEVAELKEKVAKHVQSK